MAACDRVIAGIEVIVVTGLFILMFAGTASAGEAAHATRRTLVPALASAFLLLTAAMVSGAEPTPSASPVQAVDWQTSALDLDLRGMNGERYTFLCPPGKPLPSRISGSGPYTDDSSICTAAVHAGSLRAKTGGEVTIEIRPGQAAYFGSEQNYIASGSYDHSWSGSFVVIKPDADAPRPPTN